MSLNKSEQPLISICIPAYNAEKTVVGTVQSILDQTYRNLEILIVDNASTDHTLDLLEKFTDPRVKIYKNDVNIGAERNFSRCIELATGKYIAIFHSDDLYKPDIVQKQVRVFRENLSIGAVFTMANIINEHDKVIGERKLPIELKNNGPYCFSEIITSVLKNENFLICPSAMVKSEIYKELVPFNVDKYGTSADLDMWLRILKKRPIVILDEKLMSYRISNTQGGYLYNNLRTEEADFFKVLDFHLSVRTDAIENLSNSVLNGYELQRYMDNLRRAVNYTTKGQSKNAETLLKQSISTKVFRIAIHRIEKPKYLFSLLFGVIYLVCIYFGLGRYPSKIFHWIYGSINHQLS